MREMRLQEKSRRTRGRSPSSEVGEDRVRSRPNGSLPLLSAVAWLAEGTYLRTVFLLK